MGSIYKLALVTGAIGIGSFAVGQILINRDRRTTNVSFLKTVIHLMRDEPSVKEILGEKFRIGPKLLTDDFSKQEPKHIQLMLPVDGEKDNAYLFAYARRKTEEEKYKLYKIEMTFNKVAGRKLVLLDLGENSDATYTHEAERTDYSKIKARAELFSKLDAEFGPISPTKEWRERLEKASNNEAFSDSQPTSK